VAPKSLEHREDHLEPFCPKISFDYFSKTMITETPIATISLSFPGTLLGCTRHAPQILVVSLALNHRLPTVILSGFMVAFRSVERALNNVVSRRYK
jgi:hypothetical protein